MRIPSRSRTRTTLRSKLPHFEGRSIRVELRPELTAHRGKLLSRSQRGNPVHAGSFLRRRLIVLDSSLTRTPGQFARILIHEIFHFVWLRLGNPARSEYETLLRKELKRKVRGESGWSAEWRKDALGASPRRWREYVCESFCDTAAYLYSGSRSAETTLPVAARESRRRWFASLVDARGGVLRV